MATCAKMWLQLLRKSRKGHVHVATSICKWFRQNYWQKSFTDCRESNWLNLPLSANSNRTLDLLQNFRVRGLIYIHGGAMVQGNDSTWDFDSAEGIAKALDWIRRKTNDRALVLVAVGVNGVAYSKAVALEPRDAANLIEAQLPTLRRGFESLKANRVTRAASRREDV